MHSESAKAAWAGRHEPAPATVLPSSCEHLIPLLQATYLGCQNAGGTDNKRHSNPTEQLDPVVLVLFKTNHPSLPPGSSWLFLLNDFPEIAVTKSPEMHVALEETSTYVQRRRLEEVQHSWFLQMGWPCTEASRVGYLTASRLLPDTLHVLLPTPAPDRGQQIQVCLFWQLFPSSHAIQKREICSWS